MLIVSLSTFAGGLLTNTNQHVLFLRNLARDASTEIDAVYSNPAGLAFMPNGLHLSFNNQSAFQTRTITSTFAPFVYNGGDTTKTFKGEASVPVIPSLFAVYKNDRWAFSGSFAITGGGGKATFNNGLSSFESIIAILPVIGEDLGISKYGVDSYMEGKQYIFGLQLGATYKINDHLSVFGGLRMNFVSNSYFGYLRNIKVNNAAGDMVIASDYFEEVAKQLPENNPMKPLVGTLAEVTTDKDLDCDQKGWGVTPIIGANFNMGKWNVGVKYEFNTKLNVENKTVINSTGFPAYNDGVNTPHDIPSLLTVGVSYEILPVLRASVGYHHFFDTHAKMADNRQKHLSGGTNEYLGGLEWDVTKVIQVSGGMQRTKYGLKDDFMNDISFNVSSYTFGFGAGFKVAQNIKLNVGYFWTNYETYDRESASYNDIPGKLVGMNVSEAVASAIPAIPGKDSFTRTNKVFGIGIDYTF
ncbi:MAG: hypothetical protein LIP08_06755 [Bacteroides sp.]|nr:hypothetical protein [Bacteroides sp.]